MPKYTNNTIKHQGMESLRVPPQAVDFPSIYFINDANLDTTDCEPYYNPVLFKQIVNFSGGEEVEIILPDITMGLNAFIYIQAISSNLLMTDINVFFNSLTNTPSLPIGNSLFNMNNNNRIKRLYINIAAGKTGQLIVLVTDKYVVSEATLDYDYKA
jgi:hypothetical protein